MTTFLIILGLSALAASLAFLVAGTRWDLSQLSDHDCCIDLDDCL